MDKIVVYCGTRNVYRAMTVAAKSLLVHTPVDRVIFCIDDDTFPYYVPDIISTINVSGQQWFTPNAINTRSTWPYMAFIRLALTKILPDIHTILYLDTDTLVLRDISPIFLTDLSEDYFAMVREDISGDIPTLEICKAFSCIDKSIVYFQSDNPRPAYTTHPYYNSGVALMNLDLLRSSGMDDTLITEVNTVPHPYPDQDAINLLCKDHIAPLPTEYNIIASINPNFPFDQIRIKHFASDKPLWKSSLWQSYKRLLWQDVLSKQNHLKGANNYDR